MKHIVFISMVMVGLGLFLPLVRSLVQVSWVRVLRERTLHSVSGYTSPPDSPSTGTHKDIR